MDCHTFGRRIARKDRWGLTYQELRGWAGPGGLRCDHWTRPMTAMWWNWNLCRVSSPLRLISRSKYLSPALA